MKILCLHGFRTSGSFLHKQISKWGPSIFADFHLEFPDGMFPAGGKSDIEGIFPPPYFEWFQFNKEFTEYTNLEECISYLCEYITTKGPFDGLLGFSQGATLSALLLGYQAQGKVLKEHPPMKLFVSISGSKFRDPSICDVAYKDPIKVRSVHFIGAKDWLRLPSEDLATAFDNPLIIRHPQGHTVPRLDEAATEQLRSWTKEILFHQSNNTSINKHNLEQKNMVDGACKTKPAEGITETQMENGEVKEKGHAGREEEACKTQNTEGVIEIKMENGEVKEKGHAGKEEEACKTQNTEGVIEIKMENGAGGLEATQA